MHGQDQAYPKTLTARQRRDPPAPWALRIRIFLVPWLIPAWAKAQTWGPIILVKRGVPLTENLVAHELAHVLQWRALGVRRFPFRYLRYLVLYGYEAHPLEAAARAAETDDFLLNWARRILPSRGFPDFPEKG